MSISLNSPLGDVLVGCSGLLFPVNAKDKKPGAPDYEGFIERQIKGEDGNYRTIHRLPLVGWNSKNKDKTMSFVSVVVADGLVRGALFKNDKPQGESPPDATGTLGEKDTGQVGFAARKFTPKAGGWAYRLSVYARKDSGSGAAPASGGHASSSNDDPFGSPSDFEDEHIPF